jgi:hypothetical protein
MSIVGTKAQSSRLISVKRDRSRAWRSIAAVMFCVAVIPIGGCAALDGAASSATGPIGTGVTSAIERLVEAAILTALF